MYLVQTDVIKMYAKSGMRLYDEIQHGRQLSDNVKMMSTNYDDRNGNNHGASAINESLRHIASQKVSLQYLSYLVRKALNYIIILELSSRKIPSHPIQQILIYTH